MIDVDSILRAELPRLYRVDATPDWDDVLALGRERPARWRQRPRRIVAVALALALIVLFATPAFGLRGYVLNLLGRRDVSFANSPSASNVVKKQFLDLPIGAPRQFAPDVKAAQARLVATFSIAGHPRKLWVAPTREGGYCYTFEQSFGGCRRTRPDRSLGKRGQLGVTWMGGSARHGVNPGIVTRVGGDITVPAAAKITATYADGTTADIPFVWVSAPIAAGFFTFDIPRAHWVVQHRLLSLTLSAKNGRLLGRQAFPYETHPRPVAIPTAPTHVVTPRGRVLPTAPPIPPSRPIQEATADGFQVIVGHNGSVQFAQTRETPILAELRGHSVGIGCFRLTKEFGIFTVRGLSQEARLAPRAGFVLSGVGTPVDGCEVAASIGHRWPDRLHNRAAAEIPLTAAGSRYFADRAAARDLALFVRSRRMHTLRAQPAAQAKRAILDAYGKALARSPIRIAVVDPATLELSEQSSTGRSFRVTIHDGRIAKQNLEPYAFVF